MTKPQLPVKVVTLKKVDYNDLDQFINKVYGAVGGRRFECIPDQEWSNYQDHELDVEKDELDKYDQDKLLKFYDWISGGETKRCPDGMFYILLSDMANNDVLPEGKYLVEVFW